jgi:hypothetical protein
MCVCVCVCVCVRVCVCVWSWSRWRVAVVVAAVGEETVHVVVKVFHHSRKAYEQSHRDCNRHGANAWVRTNVDKLSEDQELQPDDHECEVRGTRPDDPEEKPNHHHCRNTSHDCLAELGLLLLHLRSHDGGSSGRRWRLIREGDQCVTAITRNT